MAAGRGSVRHARGNGTPADAPRSLSCLQLIVIKGDIKGSKGQLLNIDGIDGVVKVRRPCVAVPARNLAHPGSQPESRSD